MAGKEPFRSLFEEARAAEGKAAAPARPAKVAPVPLAERLDKLDLAGGTPARGTVLPALDDALDDAPLGSALEDLFEALDVPGEPTRALPGGAAVDAALQDSIAELEATVEIPAQRRMAAREQPLTSDLGRLTGLRPPVAAPRASPRPVTPAAAAAVARVPAPVVLRPTPAREVPRPPPLPAGKPKARIEPVATHAPPPVLSEVAPEPRMLQVLGEENTIPGLVPTTRSSSSGKVSRTSDLYRLQLEFEDTPARPLPRVAFVPPPPLPPAAKRPPHKGAVPPRSSEALADLHELEAIDDLRAMAKALGLDGVGEVSIPSLEGLPVLDDGAGTMALPLLPELDELGLPASARAPSARAVRAALERELFDDSVESVFRDQRADDGAGAPRPALASGRAVSPVIVKIPARPKVSLESRERARRYYLDAVDLLGKGERSAAVQHLRMAIEHDDAIPLYRDLLEHLEEHLPPTVVPAETPALTVLGPDGKRSAARDHWRSARPR